MDKRKRQVYFFIRNFANYDHLAPIIHLLSLKKKVELNLVYSKINYDYNLDHYHHFFKENKEINIIDYTNSFKNNKFFTFVFLGILIKLNYYFKNKFLNKIILKIEAIQDNIFDKILFFEFNKEIKNKQILGIFDYSSSIPTNKIKDLIYLNGGQCFNFPHAVWLWENNLRCLDMMSFDENDPCSFGSFYQKDINIVENTKSREIVKSLGSKEKNIKFFGSPRFSRKWVMNKRKLLKEKKFTFNNKKNKILLLAPKRWDNIFWDELIRSITLFADKKSAVVVIKKHPSHKRNYNSAFPYKIRNANNIKIISNEYSSSELIDWSDIVVNVNTTIFFEAIIKKKIFINLNHLHINQFFFTSMNAYYETKNRDELVKFIRDVQKNPKNLKSNKKSVEKLLFKTIYKNSINPDEELATYLENFSI